MFTLILINKQLFEQLYFKIYNTGMQIPLKKPAVGWTSNWQHFDYMEDFFNGLPFSEIKGIYIIVQPAQSYLIKLFTVFKTRIDG